MPGDEYMKVSSASSKLHNPGVLLRLQYACYLFFGLVVAMLLRGSLYKLFGKISIIRQGCEYAAKSSGTDFCTGEVMVYRLSFALAVFFFLHFLIVSDIFCCIQSEARAEFQQRFFVVKTLFLVLIFIATIWIPNTFFVYYAYVCLFASGFFLLLNVVFLIDFSYHLSEEWGQRSEENTKWKWYLLTIALGTFAAGLAVTGVSYYLFVPHSNCAFNITSITAVIISAVVYTCLSIWVPHGSIVPSGIVFAYASCTMLITLRSSHDQRCSRVALADGAAGSWLQMIFASVVSGIALSWSVVSSGGNSEALGIGVDEKGEEEDPDRVGHLGKYMFFYFTMILGSMYLAMLASGWRVAGGGEEAMVNSVNLAMWVRCATAWAAALLYIWSLLSPYFCCSDRDFGYTISDDW